MTEELRLNLLGLPQILEGTRPLTGFTTNKAQALLFYLAVMAQKEGAPTISHSRESLANLLWGEMPDVNARRNLRAILPDLRRLVGEHIHIDRQSISFGAKRPFWLDVHQFQKQLSKPVDVTTWQTAVNLYQGEFLSGFAVTNASNFDLWLMEQRQMLHITAVEALLTLVNEYKKMNNISVALTNNRRLLNLEPWSEPVHRQQMLLLAQSGERSAALGQFDTCRTILQEEFGVEPLPETIALYEQIRTGAFQPFEQQTPLLLKTAVSPNQLILPTGIGSQKATMIVNQRDLPPNKSLIGRGAELAELKAWVESPGCRLVGVYAIGGQGKTVLAASLAHQLLAKSSPDEATSWQAILWQSLLNAPPLTEVLQKWIYYLSQQTISKLPDSLDQQFDLLLDFLQQKRTLLILDNFETILEAEGQYGRYRPSYEPYEQLLERLSQTPHDGCLLLTSRERPRGLAQLEKETGAVHAVTLAGLNSEAGGEMLSGLGLQMADEHISALTRQYSGNPLALKLAADTIQDIFGGSVTAFLKMETAVFDNIRAVLDQQFNRLSQLEHDLIVWLAIVREPISFTELLGLLAHPPASHRMIESVRSLRRRSLIEKHGEQFGLQNVIMEYVTDLTIEKMVNEFLHGTVENEWLGGWLNRHPLILAQNKAYIRNSQRRLILNPVITQLTSTLGTKQTIKKLQSHLAQLQTKPRTPGFAATNMLHILLALDANLRGADLSHLHFRQLYLRGVHLRQVDFSHAEVVDSVFTEPFGIVNTAVFSRTNRYLAAGTNEGVIYIWQTSNQQLARTIEGHQQAVNQLAFGEWETLEEKFDLLVSAGNDGRLGVWALAEAKSEQWHCYMTHPQHGRLISVRINGRILIGVNTEGRVFLWDIANHEKPRLIEHFHTMPTRFGLVAYDAANKTIAICNRNGRLKLISSVDKRPLAEWSVNMKTTASLAMRQDGQQIAIGSKHGQLSLWGKTPDRQQWHELCRYRISSAAIDALAFSPDGRKIASTHGVGDHKIRLWTVVEQADLRLEHTLSGHTHIIWSVAFSHSLDAIHSDNVYGKRPFLVTGSSDQTVQVWDAESGHAFYTFNGHRRALSALSIRPLDETTPNSWQLAVAGYDHMVHLWRGQGYDAGSEWRTFHGTSGALYAVAISQNGRLLATAGHDKLVYVWDIENGNLLKTFHGHTNSIYYLAFHPNNHLLLSGSTDGTVRFWTLPCGEDSPLINQTVQDDPTIIQAHPKIFYNADLSPNGRLLATVGADLIVRFWDLTQDSFPERLDLRKTVSHPNEQDIDSVAFSPDGTKVACGGSRAVHLWEINQSEESLILCQHTLSIFTLTFSPDGTILASGSEDGTVCLWNVATGKCQHVLRGHTDTIYQVAFTPDSSFILSCSFDGTIKFWDSQTGICVRSLKVEDPYWNMKISGIQGISEAQKSALQALGAIAST